MPTFEYAISYFPANITSSGNCLITNNNTSQNLYVKYYAGYGDVNTVVLSPGNKLTINTFSSIGVYISSTNVNGPYEAHIQPNVGYAIVSYLYNEGHGLSPSGYRDDRTGIAVSRSFDTFPPTGPEQLNFTVPPTTEIYNINLSSAFGGVNIEPSATEDTYGTWPMSYGSNITLTASGKLAHLLLTPKVATKPNVSQSVDVTVNGTTTTYPLTQNPNIDLWAGKDVKVEVSSPAPTVTVDYTNTSTPVITDTPTGG